MTSTPSAAAVESVEVAEVADHDLLAGEERLVGVGTREQHDAVVSGGEDPRGSPAPCALFRRCTALSSSSSSLARSAVSRCCGPVHPSMRRRRIRSRPSRLCRRCTSPSSHRSSTSCPGTRLAPVSVSSERIATIVAALASRSSVESTRPEASSYRFFTASPANTRFLVGALEIEGEVMRGVPGAVDGVDAGENLLARCHAPDPIGAAKQLLHVEVGEERGAGRLLRGPAQLALPHPGGRVGEQSGSSRRGPSACASTARPSRRPWSVRTARGRRG